MNLTPIKSDDIVKCDVRGRLFYAIVIERENGTLEILPITSNITYTRVKAREVVEHFRRSRARKV